VGPGSRWGEACEALEAYGVTVVGGRIGLLNFILLAACAYCLAQAMLVSADYF
jgi:hypothetical protein